MTSEIIPIEGFTTEQEVIIMCKLIERGIIFGAALVKPLAWGHYLCEICCVEASRFIKYSLEVMKSTSEILIARSVGAAIAVPAL